VDFLQVGERCTIFVKKVKNIQEIDLNKVNTRRNFDARSLGEYSRGPPSI